MSRRIVLSILTLLVSACLVTGVLGFIAVALFAVK